MYNLAVYAQPDYKYNWYRRQGPLEPDASANVAPVNLSHNIGRYLINIAIFVSQISGFILPLFPV